MNAYCTFPKVAEFLSLIWDQGQVQHCISTAPEKAIHCIQGPYSDVVEGAV